MEAKYEVRMEQHPRYYRVVFTPDTNYGNITPHVVYNRKKAYELFAEIKALVNNTTPGRLVAYEYILNEATGNYREGYLCSCRTGRSVDTHAILENIDRELKQVTDIYNKVKAEQISESNSTLQLDMLHGLEIVDLNALTIEQQLKILEKQQVTANLRRQAKNNLQDSRDVMDDVIKMKTLLKKVQAKLRDNLNYRRKSTITTKGTYKSGSVLKIESYLAAIGFQNKEEN